MSQAVVFYLSHWTPQRKTVILHTIPDSLHFRVLKIHSLFNTFLGITEKNITTFFSPEMFQYGAGNVIIAIVTITLPLMQAA